MKLPFVQGATYSLEGIYDFLTGEGEVNCLVIESKITQDEKLVLVCAQKRIIIEVTKIYVIT
jgi:hypothetical protein